MNRPRLHKLIALRQRALDQEAVALRKALAELTRMQAQVTACDANLEVARNERRQLASHPSALLEYTQLDEWLSRCELLALSARRDLRRAEVEHQRCQRRVQAALSALKRLELLDQRLAEAERLERVAAERRQEDEFGTRVAHQRQVPPRRT
jgi:flagellar export protein FliJ